MLLLEGCDEATMGGPQTADSAPGGQGAHVPLSLPRDRIQLLHGTQQAPLSTVSAGRQRGEVACESKTPVGFVTSHSGLCPWETSPPRT